MVVSEGGNATKAIVVIQWVLDLAQPILAGGTGGRPASIVSCGERAVSCYTHENGQSLQYAPGAGAGRRSRADHRGPAEGLRVRASPGDLATFVASLEAARDQRSIARTGQRERAARLESNKTRTSDKPECQQIQNLLAKPKQQPNQYSN